jgi:hypothetical protein
MHRVRRRNEVKECAAFAAMSRRWLPRSPLLNRDPILTEQTPAAFAEQNTFEFARRRPGRP